MSAEHKTSTELMQVTDESVEDYPSLLKQEPVFGWVYAVLVCLASVVGTGGNALIILVVCSTKVSG
jgi:hypothetical protein